MTHDDIRTDAAGASKKRLVETMFDSIAPRYDALNHLLSLGIDRGWRRRVVRLAARGVREGAAASSVGDTHSAAILDVATGTGDLAIALARRLPRASVTGVDISEGMLALGREKVARAGLAARVSLRAGDAEALDFPDGAFDLVTAAFGVRNFGDVAAGLAEMRRVSGGGGRLLVLEFSEPRAGLFAAVYRFYFHRVLPWIGRAVSRDGAAYSYLPRSVDAFPAPARFAAMLGEAGFTDVKTHRLTLGVAYIYEALG